MNGIVHHHQSASLTSKEKKKKKKEDKKQNTRINQALTSWRTRKEKKILQSTSKLKKDSATFTQRAQREPLKIIMKASTQLWMARVFFLHQRENGNFVRRWKNAQTKKKDIDRKKKKMYGRKSRHLTRDCTGPRECSRTRRMNRLLFFFLFSSSFFFSF